MITAGEALTSAVRYVRPVIVISACSREHQERVLDLEHILCFLSRIHRMEEIFSGNFDSAKDKCFLHENAERSSAGEMSVEAELIIVTTVLILLEQPAVVISS